MNILSYSLDTNEFNRIFTYIFIIKIWDRLEVTHKDINQVKESKINILIHKYELLKKEQNKSIIKIFIKFIDIINGLKSLEKSYTNSELVKKILKLLSRV